MHPPFSVLMSVYVQDTPAHFRQAVESVTLKQTLPPAEVVLVVDGPLTPELETTVRDLAREIPVLKIIWLEKNTGLGNALRIGMEHVSNELVMRMDADDLSLPHRFERQVAYMQAHPECDILGGQIAEFVDTESDIVGKRIVPCENQAIYARLKGRCPFNHVSVALSRNSVLSAGNYRDWLFDEDYYLWVRMAENGCRFANLPEVLVHVRVGKDMYTRRGGWRYFVSEKKLQDYMLHCKMITWPRYIFNVTARFAIQVALPHRIRGFFFRKLFRK